MWKVGAGANMAFRRNVFDLVGLFDERLGAGAAGCSEDSEIWYRILANQLQIRYEPRAVSGTAIGSMARPFAGRWNNTCEAMWHRFWSNLKNSIISEICVACSFHFHAITGALRRAVSMAAGEGRFGLRFLAASGESCFICVQRRPCALSLKSKQSMKTMHKRPLSAFLADNPFPNPFTGGLFYREKMRAIHRVAPDCHLAHILEVGGGRSGLGGMLYPDAMITNIDMNPEYAGRPVQQTSGCDFFMRRCNAATV